MVDVDLLRKCMKEKGVTVDALCKEIGIDDSTFYRKLNSNGRTFTLEQADMIKTALDIDAITAESIFFS